MAEEEEAVEGVLRVAGTGEDGEDGSRAEDALPGTDIIADESVAV